MHPTLRQHGRPCLPALDMAAAGSHEIGRRTYLVADVQPLDVTGVRTVGVGTALWLLAFVLLLPFQGSLEDAGRTSEYAGSTHIGKIGIEQSYERLLHGQTGYEEVEVSAGGRGGAGRFRLIASVALRSGVMSFMAEPLSVSARLRSPDRKRPGFDRSKCSRRATARWLRRTCPFQRSPGQVT